MIITSQSNPIQNSNKVEMSENEEKDAMTEFTIKVMVANEADKSFNTKVMAETTMEELKAVVAKELGVENDDQILIRGMGKDGSIHDNMMVFVAMGENVDKIVFGVDHMKSLCWAVELEDGMTGEMFGDRIAEMTEVYLANLFRMVVPPGKRIEQGLALSEIGIEAGDWICLQYMSFWEQGVA
eukprot:TRINITY_DN483_c0_g1_i1.p1 TRINITY_DN483_c0_g1~~TRINITY_DN483_c0_g1_i1.p1  ORF type:complete len:183 (-),score=43.51 TRINITY_DN483_c0_g1_i1:303-851(-)